MQKLLTKSILWVAGIAILGAVVHGMAVLGWIIPVEILAVIGLYAGIYAIANLSFAKDYRNEAKVRRDGR